MKKTVNFLLVIVMALCVTLALIACDTDPCKDGHDWNGGTVTTPATCTTRGVKTFTCKNCEETKTEEIAIDPDAHSFDSATHKCACGKVDPAYAVAQVNGADYLTLSEAIAVGGEVKLIKDVMLSEQLKVTKDVVLDLNGKTISSEVDIWNDDTASYSLIAVMKAKDAAEAATLTIKGNGKVEAKENDGYAISVYYGGKLVIEDGEYIGNLNAIYVHTGTAEIKGGKFDLKQLDQEKIAVGGTGHEFTLNLLDANGKNGTAKIIVTGGTFVNYDPSNSASEAPAANFLPAGYKATENSGEYTVALCDHVNTVDNVCSDCGYELTEAEVLDVLFSLKDDKATKGTYKLTGLLTEVGFFNTQYNNIQVTMKVAGKSVLCYGLVGTEECPLAAGTLKVGQTITVSGHFVFIYNKYEFNANCQLLKIEYAQSDINVEIENGTTSLPAKATNCDTVEFTVTPNAGYRIDEVKVNGRIITDIDGKYTFNVLGDMKVTVVIVPESAKVASEIVNFDFSNSEIKTEESKVQAYYQEWTAKLGDYSLLVDNFNNNKWGWNFIRAGHKEYTNKGTMAITLAESVSKIIITVDNVNNEFMGNVTLNVKNSSGEIVETVVIEAKDVLAGHLTFRLSNPTANCIYELEFDTSTPSVKGTNGYLQISSVAFYGYTED